ncbi:hypothetical protein BJ741DRAFT_3543 [Chytriomyces cf. hyalinus JEL632]|nr:hypothetical protein BJ741DRAFT_3543 [Chytriomyces cf. hyalinus JEL632]
MPQPVSAVRVSPIDSLVLDVPVVLVSKGDGIHLWGIPRAPRGWRLGKFVSTSAVMDAQGTSKQDGQTVSVQGARKTASKERASEKQLQNRKSGSGFFGRVFGGVKPSLRQHPKYSADELNNMAREAMESEFEVDAAAGLSRESSSGEGPSTNDSNHKSREHPILPPISPTSSTVECTIEPAEIIEGSRGLRVVDLSLTATENIGVKESGDKIPSQLDSIQSENQDATSSTWEFQPELDNVFEEPTNQEEQGKMKSTSRSRGNGHHEEARFRNRKSLNHHTKCCIPQNRV